jgi:uncharacterized lipoprotein YajG
MRTLVPLVAFALLGACANAPVTAAPSAPPPAHTATKPVPRDDKWQARAAAIVE